MHIFGNKEDCLSDEDNGVVENEKEKEKTIIDQSEKFDLPLQQEDDEAAIMERNREITRNYL